MRILVIEDEPKLAGHIVRALARGGHEAASMGEGSGAVKRALDETPDLILLDLNLPGLDGFGILARLKEARSAARVLILTARGEVDDRVRGLRAGADDYLAKPFAMEELIARVEALGRRGLYGTGSETLQVAGLHLDIHSRRVWRDGTTILLSPREFEVLRVLMLEPGRIFSRTELCERVWQRDHEYDTRTVEIYITRLRKKVDSDFPAPLIRTFRGSGYSIMESQPCA